MKRLISFIISTTLLTIISCSFYTAHAATEQLNFKNQTQQKRYQHIIAELRCLVCQNQNLADSDAELAQDLRSKTHNMILNGNSDAEIYEFMRSRYGDFVLYKPPLNSKTWLLWFGPFLLLLAAIGIAFKSIRMRAKYHKESEAKIQPNKQNQAKQLGIQNLLRDTPSLSRQSKQAKKNSKANNSRPRVKK